VDFYKIHFAIGGHLLRGIVLEKKEAHVCHFAIGGHLLRGIVLEKKEAHV